MVENNGKDGQELSRDRVLQGLRDAHSSRLGQSIMHQRLEEEGPHSSVNDTEPRVLDIIRKPRRVSPVVELADRLVVEADQLAQEEAKRAEEIEAATVRAQGIVRAAERNADQLQSEVRALADNITEELRSVVTRMNDLILGFYR